MTPTEPELPAEPDPRRWRALAVTLTAGFMVLLDVSIVNVALPSIQRDLAATAGGVQWVVSGYALTFGLVLVFGGRLGDALGRRRMFLIALTGFVLTSALAGAATTPELLIVARLLQGMAAGLLTPQNTGLIQELFRGPERGRAFGLFGAVVGISTAVGPVLGGVILAVFGDPEGWRWVFLVNIPIGALALVLAARLLPKSPARLRGVARELDFLGAVLLGLAVVGVLFPILEIEQGNLGQVWWLFPLAIVLGAVFVWWERRLVRLGRPPLLDLRLFSTVPGFASGATLGTVYFCAFTGIWLVFAVFFQQGLGFTPLESGLAVTPFAVGSAVSAIIAGRLIERWGRRLTVTGLSLVTFGLLAVAGLALLVPAHSLGWAMVLPLLIAGIGGGMVISPNTTLTLERVPTTMAGVAGGALQTGQRLGTAVGTAVLATVFHTAISATGADYPLSLSISMVCAALLTMIALGLGVAELRNRTLRVRTA
ncbi:MULTISPECIES: MFS transporter [unclassified Crossiella]|uniref:MFS transporter n=1 Tax=unclassified Crossiella TaxID=2620835 RepID=UPI001FFEF16C|nr:MULTISPECIES: MFS transporter [unclassified Crossiella]MCK2244299.1 MFS transporter [Crossiella sp. S99.2]MCK2257873.1 MFS transporter [Crossiella sp. S99.1]